MSQYSHDMSQESGTATQAALDEGWHDFEIVNMEEQTSKSGNQMFKISFALADNPQKGLIAYAVAEPKKRWYLKNLLDAVGCDGGKDGVYNWSVEDVMGHTVSGRVENAVELWKDRSGKERKSTKSKLVEFAPMGVNATPKEDDPFSL